MASLPRFITLIVVGTATPALAQQDLALDHEVVAPALARPHPPTRLYSPGLAAGGAGVLILGLATGVGAGFLTFWAVTSHSATDRGVDPPPYALLGAAIPVQVLALAGIVGGIVMIAVGARQVPAEHLAFGPGGLAIAW